MTLRQELERSPAFTTHGTSAKLKSVSDKYCTTLYSEKLYVRTKMSESLGPDMKQTLPSQLAGMKSSKPKEL